MNELPQGFLRLKQIIGSKATAESPAIPAIIPVCKSTWWKGVASGRFPKPTRKLGIRITAWSIESIRELERDLANDAPLPESNSKDEKQKEAELEGGTTLELTSKL